jgi:hypothetical protein
VSELGRVKALSGFLKLIDRVPNMEKWIEENCECGLRENGKWSEALMEEFGCTCDENFDIGKQYDLS